MKGCLRRDVGWGGVGRVQFVQQLVDGGVEPGVVVLGLRRNREALQGYVGRRCGGLRRGWRSRPPWSRGERRREGVFPTETSEWTGCLRALLG